MSGGCQEGAERGRMQEGEGGFSLHKLKEMKLTLCNGVAEKF